MYTIEEVAVRAPFFFHSLRCASPRKSSPPGSSTDGGPPEAGPSLSSHACTPAEEVSGSTGLQTPVRLVGDVGRYAEI